MRIAADPLVTTNSSSEVNECGVGSVPGAISTFQIDVDLVPFDGVASEVNRVDPTSWVGDMGAAMTGTETSR